MSRPRPPRRRVSRQRYMVRRVVAIVAVLAVGYLVVRGVGAVWGDDSGDADAELVATLDAASSSAAGSAVPDETTATTEAGAGAGRRAGQGGSGQGGARQGGSTTEPADERTGPPTPSDPAQVLIVGDSDAGTFGPYLEELLDATRLVETELDYKVSSGLARPDFYDWPEALRKKVPEVDPDIVVVTFGGNDSQGLSTPGELNFIVGDPLDNEAEWSEEYERRVGEVMDLLLDDDRSVIWVGIPNDDNPEVTAKLALQDEAVRAAAADRPEVVFVDTWTRFSGRDGNWAEFVIDPRDGEGKDVRADDGFHLNVAGAEILAIDVAQAVRDELRAMGADI